MPENLQDKLISDYVYKEYDIAYPVIITHWEIMQVNGLDKRYLQVYFQKISDTVKAFKFNVKCYSDFGEVENLSDISLLEVDKIGLEFFKVVPVKAEVNRVEINIQQCLLLDNSIIEPKGKQMVVNTFMPFNKEDLEVGKRLLPNAKGYPIDNVSHWYCACGALHSSNTQMCGKCNKSKKAIFCLITPEKITEERVNQINQEEVIVKAKKKKKITIASIASGCTAFILALFLILWFTVIPIPTVKQNGITYSRDSDGHYWAKVYDYQDSTITINATLRGLPVNHIFGTTGNKTVKEIYICGKMKSCKYHSPSEHYSDILRCYNSYNNLKTIYIEEEKPIELKDSYKDNKIGEVNIVWGYKSK